MDKQAGAGGIWRGAQGFYRHSAWVVVIWIVGALAVVALGSGISGCHRASAAEAGLSPDDSESLAVAEASSPPLDMPRYAPAPPPAISMVAAYAMSLAAPGMVAPHPTVAGLAQMNQFQVNSSASGTLVWGTATLEFRALSTEAWQSKQELGWNDDAMMEGDGNGFYAMRSFSTGPLSPGHWRVRGTATVILSNNTVVPLEASYEYIVVALCLHADKEEVDDDGFKQTVAGWSAPRRKILLSWQPLDTATTLPEGYAIRLSSGLADPPTSLRVWTAASKGSQLPWEVWPVAVPGIPPENSLFFPGTPMEFFIDCGGGAGEGATLELSVVPKGYYDRLSAAGDPAIGNSIETFFREALVVRPPLFSLQPKTAKRSNAFGVPIYYVEVDGGFEKAAQDGDGWPVEDFAAPDAAGCSAGDTELVPLIFQLSLMDEVVVASGGLGRLAGWDAGDAGAIRIWRYDRWRGCCLPVVPGEEFEIPDPANLPAGTSAFYLEGRGLGDIHSLSIEAQYKPAGFAEGEEPVQFDSRQISVLSTDLLAAGAAVLEDAPGQPGLALPVNKNSLADAPLLPAYAQNFSRSPVSPGTTRRMLWRLPEFGDPGLFATFTYDAAPASMPRLAHPDNAPRVEAGHFRLWGKQADGSWFFIPSGVPIPHETISRLVADGDGRLLAVEAVGLAQDGCFTGSVHVAVSLPSLPMTLKDSVKFTACDIDLDGDCDGDGDIDNSESEALAEDSPGGGLLVPGNHDDDDGNGVRDGREPGLLHLADDELMPLQIRRCLGDTTAVAHLNLAPGQNGRGIRIWRDCFKSVELTLPYEFQKGDPELFYVEATKDPVGIVYAQLLLSLEDPVSGRIQSDTLTLKSLAPDLDLCGNSRIFASISPRDAEALEDVPPGQMVLACQGDVDGDGVPDYADGFDLEPDDPTDPVEIALFKARDDASIHQMALGLLRLPYGIDFSKATLRIVYAASDPALVEHRGDGVNESWWLPEQGSLRLWRNSKSDYRSLGSWHRRAASALAEVPGDYIAPGVYDAKALAYLGMDRKTHSAWIWLEPIYRSKAPGDMRVEVFLDPDGPGPFLETRLHDAIRITAIDPVDIDLDSDNDGVVEPEDTIEDQQDRRPSHPGKVIVPNFGDLNTDGLPDFANCSSGSLVGELADCRIRLTLPPGVEWKDCVVSIHYMAADPRLCVSDAQGHLQWLAVGTTPPYGAVCLPPSTGLLRLWRQGADGFVRFVDSKTWYGSARVPGGIVAAENSLSDLGISEVGPSEVILNLKAEALHRTCLSGMTIVVLLDCSQDAEKVPAVYSDAVRATIMEVDLDVDSDNNGVLERSTAEDLLEDLADHVAKVLPLADGDADGDGIPDFADGFDAEPTKAGDSPAVAVAKECDDSSPHQLTEMRLELPFGSNLDQVSLSVGYDASDPSLVTVLEEDGIRKFTLPLAGGAIRLWAMPRDKATGKPFGLGARRKADIRQVDFGHYVAPGEYRGRDVLERLGFSQDNLSTTLWIEGVRPCTAADGVRITVAVKSVVPGTPTMVQDSVRVTVAKTAILPDWNRDGRIDAVDAGRVDVRTPWRIWKNDDRDKDAGEVASDWRVDLPMETAGDSQDAVVNGFRDTIDFFPLALDLKSLVQWLPPERYHYQLRRQGGGLKGLWNLPGVGAGNLREFYRNQDLVNVIMATSPLVEIGDQGAEMPSEWLRQERPLLFVEGTKTAVAPLELVVCSGTTVLLACKLPLQVGSVEQMFFQKDLSLEAGTSAGTGDRLTPTRLPYFTSALEALVFVHGYNIGPDEAKASFAELYKRFFHSGCNARFYGVNWNGLPPAIGAPHYHQAVVNALASAKGFASFVNAKLPPKRTVLAHSLGNMLVGEAVCQYQAKVTNYVALNAAVPLEAWGDIVTPEDLQGLPLGTESPKYFLDSKGWPYNVAIDSGTTWAQYVEAGAGKLLASEWHLLFPGTDRRRQLTWRSRFLALPAKTKVYNFYASTEEILANLDDDRMFFNDGLQTPIARYAWQKQEKMKGRRHFYNLIGAIPWENVGGSMSDFAGWTPNPFYRRLGAGNDNAVVQLVGFAWANGAAAIGLFTGTSSAVATAFSTRFQELGWTETPVDIAMATGEAVWGFLKASWNFLSGVFVNTTGTMANISTVTFTRPSQLITLLTLPPPEQAMDHVRSLAQKTRQLSGQEVGENDLLRERPYFAIDSGCYLESLNAFRKERFENLVKSCDGVSPSQFLAKKATEVSDVTGYYNANAMALGKVTVKDWLLAEAFPATTNAAGANPATSPGIANLNLPLSCMTDASRWPEREGKRLWYHSDFIEVSYLHTFKLYDAIAQGI